MNNRNHISKFSGRLATVTGVMVLLLAILLLWQVTEIQAGATPPAWEALAQHEATASYWLDDDLGPEKGAPQEVDEQEHVY